MRDDLLNETLAFGLVHAGSLVADRLADCNAARPYSAPGGQTPAAHAAQRALRASGQLSTAGPGFSRIKVTLESECGGKDHAPDPGADPGTCARVAAATFRQSLFRRGEIEEKYTISYSYNIA